ncbi:sulfur carrier protein ThiS [Sphingobacterium haloxyli]|uniref:Thiamine biosynthesis protein ThiS n=1 Tax=Sphingobacterium haloxyli TaxID=2100533 RepID=A0A2S9J0M1_9SPHI|nr:sulfur carrier protein ThiS [Sphingobacterium haloxyli]PRD46308.1 thiamine biosynthesis protein ThiS [Sphingobacterium haloxyli]
MELIINHQQKFFGKAPASLAELMQLEAPGKTKGVAVAINSRVVPKTQWESTVLRDRDSILIITATQGG